MERVTYKQTHAHTHIFFFQLPCVALLFLALPPPMTFPRDSKVYQLQHSVSSLKLCVELKQLTSWFTVYSDCELNPENEVVMLGQ